MKYKPYSNGSIPISLVKKIICSCKRDGRCKLIVENRETTLMPVQSYYDSRGIYHVNDKNRRTDIVTCLTHGKQWRTISHGKISMINEVEGD